MKTVFKNNAEVTHAWANGLSDHGRNPLRSLYFNTRQQGENKHRIIYSYGSHFPIASIVNNSVAFLTFRSYSPTTSNHIGLVRASIPHNIPVVECYYPDDLISDDNFQRPQKELEYLTAKLAKARKPEIYLLEIKNLSLRFEAFVNQLRTLSYNVDRKLEETHSTPLLSLHEDVENRLVAYQDEIERIKEENEKRRLLEIETNIKRFRAGEIDKVFSPFQALRLHGDFIRTSLMVDVPISSVEGIIRFFVRNIDDEKHLNRLINRHVENFTINEINFSDKYVVIGCHKIKFEEIINIEKQIFRQVI